MTKENELIRLLAQEASAVTSASRDILDRIKEEVSHYAATDCSLAVLTDIVEEKSYVYNGSFGYAIGLAEGLTIIDAMMEQEIFSCIPDDELTQRHVTELRFALFQQQQPTEERRFYNTVQLLHFNTTDGVTVPVLHRTYVAASDPGGALWLSLCLYSPFVECTMTPAVINNRTGRPVPSATIAPLEEALLSAREKEILRLLAKGYLSKQIADELCISIHTVNRHRQNIISAMHVANTAQAVSAALSIGLI